VLSEFLLRDDFSRGLAEEVSLLFFEALCCFKFASGEVGDDALLSSFTVASVGVMPLQRGRRADLMQEHQEIYPWQLR